jgi:hypothetical protein
VPRTALTSYETDIAVSLGDSAPLALVAYLRSLEATREAYLTLSEVLGHVDLLTNAGRVWNVERGGTAVFEAA